MTETGYIHINQAVRTYDRTRQTFYNYINKGYVKSKKVHNKLFLCIEDIESILDDYIDHVNDPEIIEGNHTAHGDKKTTQSNSVISNNKHENTHIEMKFQESPLTNASPSSSSSSLTYHLSSLLEGFSSKVSRDIHQAQEQIKTQHTYLAKDIHNIQATMQQTHESHQSIIGSLQHLLEKQQKKQSKILFRLYFLIFIGVNAIVLRVLSR